MRVEEYTEEELLTRLQGSVRAAIYHGTVPGNVSSLTHLGEHIDLDIFAGGLLREVYQSVDTLEKIANAQSRLNTWLNAGGAQMRPLGEVLHAAARQPDGSIVSRVEREFSTGWAKQNPLLFAERMREFFATYTQENGYVFTSEVRDGFITMIAETPDERARGEAFASYVNYADAMAEKFDK